MQCWPLTLIHIAINGAEINIQTGCEVSLICNSFFQVEILKKVQCSKLNIDENVHESLRRQSNAVHTNILR
jgi:hypothetical protein